MNVFKEDSVYLVADDETRLVYARAPSASVATGVTLGILNSFVLRLPVEIPHLKNTWDAYDFDKDLYQAEFSSEIGVRFARFPDELLRADLLKNRKLASRRACYLHALEVHCRDQLARIAEFVPDNLTAFLHDELRNCNPSKNVFARSIEEYAALSEIEPAAACQELQLKLKSSGLVSLRTYALQQKFMMKMNACETEQDLDKVFAEFFQAIFYKALA
jgi:hypothetical protein